MFNRQLMLEGICMCFYKAIVQSMFKYVASENAPLVLTLSGPEGGGGGGSEARMTKLKVANQKPLIL